MPCKDCYLIDIFGHRPGEVLLMAGVFADLFDWEVDFDEAFAVLGHVVFTLRDFSMILSTAFTASRASSIFT